MKKEPGEVIGIQVKKEEAALGKIPRRIKLKEELRASHVSLRDLGTHLVKPYQTIQKWINGDRPIPEADYAKAMLFIRKQKTLKSSNSSHTVTAGESADQHALLDHLHRRS